MEPRGRQVRNGQRASVGALVVLGMASTFLAAAPWLRAFPTASMLPLLLGASILSVGAPFAIGRSSRAPAVLATAGSGVLLVVFLLVAVVHDPTRPTELVEGVTRGAALLVSTALPIVHPRWVLVVPVTLCWVTGTAATVLVHRLRTPGWAIVVWTACVVSACALTTGGGRADLAATLPLAVGCGLLVLADRWRSSTTAGTPVISPGGLAAHSAGETGSDPVGSGSRESVPDTDQHHRSLRSLAIGGVILLAVTAAIGAGLPTASSLRRAPVAFRRQPEVDLLHPIAPPIALAELRYGLDGPKVTPLFSVRTSATVPGYLTVAVLDDYRGSGWSLRRTFEPSGGTIPWPGGLPPRGAGTSLATRTVTSVAIRHTLPFPWMPYVGRPEAVSGLDVAFDPTSGMILPSRPLTTGERYTVTSRTPTRTLASLGPATRAATIGGTDDPADLQGWQAEATDLSAYVDELATATGRPPSPSLPFLEAVAAYMRTRYRQIMPSAVAAHGVVATTSDTDLYGTSFAAVASAVMSSRHRATPEQFATFFVLLARSLGVPARLATGFRVENTDGNTVALTAGRSTTVTAADAWTWAEIPVAGTGWVVVNPTPAATGAAAPTPALESVPATARPNQVRAVSAPGSTGHALAPQVRLHRPRPAPERPFPVAPAVGAAVVLVVLVALSTTVGAKWRRRRRRRHATGLGHQVEGAWLETLDHLEEAALTGLGPLTGAEIVDRVRTRFGPGTAGPVRTIAAHAEVAVFADESALAPDAAEVAWRAHHTVRATIRRGQPVGARLLTIVRKSRHRWD